MDIVADIDSRYHGHCTHVEFQELFQLHVSSKDEKFQAHELSIQLVKSFSCRSFVASFYRISHMAFHYLSISSRSSHHTLEDRCRINMTTHTTNTIRGSAAKEESPSLLLLADLSKGLEVEHFANRHTPSGK